jgi:hypothetical protein
MSSENDSRLRETLEEHRRLLHDKQLAADAVAAKDHEFMQQYVAHRAGVIAPTLDKLKKLVREYGHDLVIDDSVGNESPAIAERGPIQATLVLKGYDLTYKSASPQLGFSANCASRTIAVYASDRVPHKEGASGQQGARTVEELYADKIEEIFLALVQRAFAH